MIWSLSEGRVALVGDRVVGTALMTPFGDTCSAINMIIIDESQRGRGLGRQLTSAVMELAGDRECRLTATSDGLPLYEKLGFIATHQIVRHQGVIGHVDTPENVGWIGPAFAFGDETAASLGVHVGRARLALFALTAMMTATIVSMVGTIGFVGLVVPHAARFLVGPLHVRLLPACAITGAIFMVLADIASRVLIPQQVLPIGVVTALVGVPFFSFILYRYQRAS